MGRTLLTAALAALVGCTAAPQVTNDTAPHADMACAACHTAPPGARNVGMVPRQSCEAADCHPDAGPAEVELASARFEHRDHAASDSLVSPSCAGCHSHTAAGEPLTASVDACALCHIGQVTGTSAEECRLCHQEPDHAGLTSQGVAVSHSMLPWIELGCVRCHYDVADPPTDVASSRCAGCHAAEEDITAAGIGRDLHPEHAGLTCTSCHQGETHRVQAMSSAVSLVCSDCHRREHGVPIERGPWPQPELCEACHRDVHRPQQQLLLGVAADGRAEPSSKFLFGITCRSCHVPTAATAASTEPIRGQAAACEGCHRREYATVLDWWIEGLDDRGRRAAAYVAQAERRLGDTAPDSAAALLAQARSMVSLVREAGGQHNLELSDHLFREAVDRVESAYGVAGRPPPTPPDFGNVPHTGLCSYCHYAPGEPFDLREMPSDFHESVMEQR